MESSKTHQVEEPKVHSTGHYLLYLIGPIILTAVSFWLHVYEIDSNKHVIWDEAHFAKFGAYYNRHEFYHDVHPPLGKMLCGLSEYLSGFNNTDFKFESGHHYPTDINIRFMRLFQACFSSLITPVCYFTCRQLGFDLWSTYFISITVCLQISLIVLGKFVLLDSFLIFFIAATFMCLARMYRLRHREGTRTWKAWLFITGICIGCACSVKWVGLFVTAVVGLYTILDLWLKFWDTTHFSWKKYSKCWFYRVVDLIVVPVFIYLLCFKIHYALLYKPGSGSGSMSTLFQVNLRQTDIGAQPRFVSIDSQVTIRSQGLSPNLLHSHSQLYPDGSNQHQVTTYGYKDANNIWRFRPARENGLKVGKYIKDGDTVRLQHTSTHANLHSHEIHGHVSKQYQEVSGYGDEKVGDQKDDWIFEIVSQVHSSNQTYASIHETDEMYYDYIHPVSTTFRLRHRYLGCYLATTGLSYPAWGFKQGEVICKPAAPLGSISAKFDKSTWWNIESVETHFIPADHEYSYPKSSFLSDFLTTQHAMMASNNGLVPDEDKFDPIASSWWEWPLLRGGIRMSSFAQWLRRYYMFESPFTMWFSTICVFAFVAIMIRVAFLWQHQSIVIDQETAARLLMMGVAPFLGWIFHYLPFIIMGRITYFHHYTPALYFAIFVTGFVIDFLTKRLGKHLKAAVYIVLYGCVIYSFYLFSPTCLGMTGSLDKYNYMDWFKDWEMANYTPFSIGAIWEHTQGDLLASWRYASNMVKSKL